jgi:hypothetical protein
MGFRFQRRLNITRGMGLNISKSGVSPSLRTGFGSIGAKGFSIRTGIPGLSFRQGFGKSSGGAGIIIGLLMLVIALLPVLVSLLIIAAQLSFSFLVWAVRIFIIAPFNMIVWGIQSLGDFIAHKRGRGTDMQAPEKQLQLDPEISRNEQLEPTKSEQTIN